MQCHQIPPFFYSSANAFPVFGQHFPCVSDNHIDPMEAYVGEGDVMTVVNQDGSLQFYFIPIKNTPDHLSQFTFTQDHLPEAWRIKSVSNPLPAPLFYQQLQTSVFLRKLRKPPGYQLKFHSDSCTSTTDLQYCCQGARRGWPPSPERNVHFQVVYRHVSDGHTQSREPLSEERMSVDGGGAARASGGTQTERRRRRRWSRLRVRVEESAAGAEDKRLTARDVLRLMDRSDGFSSCDD